MKGIKLDLVKEDVEEYRDQVFSSRKDDLYLIALSQKLSIIEPESNQVFIDIDTEEDLEECIERLNVLEETLPYYINVMGYKQTPSKSGEKGKYHITITFGFDMTPLERVGMQALLNSDPKREFMNMMRVLVEADMPNIFFEKGNIEDER